MRSAMVSWLPLCALLLLVLGPAPSACVPFASVRSRVRLDYLPTPLGDSTCTLNARGLGITSITQWDITNMTQCGDDAPPNCRVACALHAVDLSSNSLSSLPSDLFAALIQDMSVIDLSDNLFTPEGMSNFFDKSHQDDAGACVFCGYRMRAPDLLDLSRNKLLGPVVPPVFGQTHLYAAHLRLIDCGFRDVPALVFAGASFKFLELNFNDLREGLHELSFAGIEYPSTLSLSLSNTNLRSSSLPRGVFDSLAAAAGGGGTGEWEALWLDNMDGDTAGDSEPLPARFMPSVVAQAAAEGRIFTRSDYNPPTADKFRRAMGNFFDPFPAGVLHDPSRDHTDRLMRPIRSVFLGDVASVAPAFLSGFALDDSYNLLRIHLAPYEVARELTNGSATPTLDTYCPMHSLAAGLSVPPAIVDENGDWVSGGELALQTPLIHLEVRGAHLPLPSVWAGSKQGAGAGAGTGESGACGSYPDCSGGACAMVGQGAIRFSVEPLFLSRDLLRWASQINTGDGYWVTTTLAYEPPPYALYHPALNTSEEGEEEWVPRDLLCEAPFFYYTLPALPRSDDATGPHFPHGALPDGMLACTSNFSTVYGIDILEYDFSMQQTFTSSAGWLQGLVTEYATKVYVAADTLFAGVRPVPAGLFDLPPGAPNLRFLQYCPSAWNGHCYIDPPTCPYQIEGVCHLCPDNGYYTRTQALSYWSNSDYVDVEYLYCAACPLGAYCNSSLSEQPQPCPAGSFQDELRHTSCKQCEVGRASADGASICLDCTPGRFSPEARDECAECPTGRFMPNSSASVCVTCEAGQYTAKKESTSCDDCPIGHECSDPSVAVPCAIGRYQAAVRHTACTLCPLGTYNPSSGQTSPMACVQCPPGRANAVEGGGLLHEACQPCPVGYSSGFSGVAICAPCVQGTFQDREGAIACELCAEGKFGVRPAANNSSACEECPTRAPKSAAGSSSVDQCIAPVCGPGRYTADIETPCQALCPAGAACPAGVVQPCSPGSYSLSPGQSRCTPCGAGLSGSYFGSFSPADCTPCPLSTYSNDTVSRSCTPCPEGQTTMSTGSTSADACQPVQAGCVTINELASSGIPISSHTRLCSLGGPTPISLSALLPGGVEQLRAFLVRAKQILNSTATSQVAVRSTVATDAVPTPTSTPTATQLSNAYSTYTPLRQAPSLRLAAFTTDPTLSDAGATVAASSGVTRDTINTSGAPIQFSTIGLIISCLLIGFLPLALYRFLPARVVLLTDQFSGVHKVPVGGVFANVPTQLGAMLSWSFLWTALMIAIILGTQSNTADNTALLPPSSAERAGTATAAWQMTLRVHTGEEASSMASWCTPSNPALLAHEAGFSSSFSLRATPTGQSCSIAADCLDCHVASLSSATFTFPHSAQLVEWELFATGAAPGAWGRRYGVLSQLPGSLMDAEASLRFSAMESYLTDDRSQHKEQSKSGFELNFIALASVSPQPVATFNARSTVSVTLQLTKSDVVLQRHLSDLQSPMQIGSLVASSVVSLFSLFAIGFKLVEKHVIKRFGLNPGEVLTEEQMQTLTKASKEEETKELKVIGGHLEFTPLQQIRGEASASPVGGAAAVSPAAQPPPALSSSSSLSSLSSARSPRLTVSQMGIEMLPPRRYVGSIATVGDHLNDEEVVERSMHERERDTLDAGAPSDA